MDRYVFDPLPPSKKRIRLLQLEGDTLLCPSIHCKLVEADYDNTFHIPTKAMSEISENSSREELHNIQNPNERLKREYQMVVEKRIEYEALSWCWGKDNPEHAVIINKDGVYYRMSVRRDLALALKYLRHPNMVR